MKGERKKKVPYYCFIVSLFISQLIAYGARLTYLEPFQALLKVFSLAMLLAAIILPLFSKKIKGILILKIIALALLGCFSLEKNGSTVIANMVLFLIASRAFDLKAILRKDLVIKTIILGIIVISWLFGLTTSQFFFRNGIIRQNFGFYHPNNLAMFLVIFIMELSIVSVKVKKHLLLIAIISALLIKSITDSNTASILLPLFASIHKILNKIENKKIIPYINVALYIGLIVISFYATKNYAYGNFYWKIDEFLSGRIWIQTGYFKKYSLSLFGNVIDFDRTLDNFYIRTALSGGILCLVFYAIIIYLQSAKAIRDNNYGSIIISALITILLYGLSENLIFYPAYTVLWLSTSAKLDREKIE